MREIDEVAVRVAHVRLHPAQAEHDLAIALRRQVFGRVQRFVERDAETALDQHRELLLLADELQQLEVLRVARADLQHDARRVAGCRERAADFVDVRLVRHLHRDHANAVFAGELEHVRQAACAEALERIRRRARLVCAHPRADLPVVAQRLHHRFDRLA